MGSSHGGGSMQRNFQAAGENRTVGLRLLVIPGQPAGLNPECRDAGFALRAPRNDIQINQIPNKKTRRDFSRRAPTFCNSLVQALRAPFCKAQIRLAGDPSEVTALGVRHWITSFSLLMETSV